MPDSMEARLDFAQFEVRPPPEYTQIWELAFDLVNTGGAKAVLRTLRLVVDESRPSETLRLVQAGAPVVIHHYRVRLTPETREVDIRGRVFGAAVEPRAFPPEEVESFLVDISSVGGYFYRCHLVADWYEVRRPGVARQSESPSFCVDFAPEPEERLKRDLAARAPTNDADPDRPKEAIPKKTSTLSSLTILFLGANPSDMTKLALPKEAQEIDDRLRATDFRDVFHVEQQWEVRAGALPGKIMRFKPQILHFSGHGDDRGELIFQDRSGTAVPAKPEMIDRLFSLLGQGIKCVVLNACYSAAQAEMISRYVDVVIGMPQAIRDEDAISFAGAFYEALGYGKDVYTAFELAKLGIEFDRDAAGDSANREVTAKDGTTVPRPSAGGSEPQLHVKNGVDPKRLFLISLAQ